MCGIKGAGSVDRYRDGSRGLESWLGDRYTYI